MMTRRSNVLRKACRNCTRSKRRCSVQLPSCTRCTNKGLACEYDLEPLSTRRESTESTATHTAELCFLDLVSSLSTQRTYSTISIPMGQSQIRYVIWLLRQTPGLVNAGEVSALVHPKLQFRGDRNYLARIAKMLERSESQEFHELLAVDIGNIPLGDAITAIQALVLYLIQFLFDVDSRVQASTESHLWLLRQWVGILWTSAWTRVPTGLSPWQAWLLGETTRRTIILSYIVMCSFTGWKYGYCLHRLLFESLPFDGRVGLWRADSPQAWIAAAGVKTGLEVGTQLESFHEFGGKVLQSFNPDDDAFMVLVHIAHNGKKAYAGITPCQ